TCIRGLDSTGQFSPAGRLLGRTYALHGKVIRGEGVGRKQTVPTLNLQPRQELLPQAGVYITRTRPASGSDRYSSLTNVGHRPTFGDHPLSIETFLLDPPEAIDEAVDFAQIEVEFLYRLRDEKKFPDSAELKRQIETDIQRAKKYFRLWEKVRPRRLSPTHR
ncbi:MAG: bifunctional riboflavin kinase/FAD synthetase, partial [Acidobacteria bacterium]|nr:bifunctional riboflavin kinase/FAD synthetase [Acidobacteriota bacterium]